MRRAYCRSCRRTTDWTAAGSYNGTHPVVVAYRCRSCMFERIEMADVPDSDGLCHSVIDAWLRQNGNQRANLDFEDLLGTVRLALWKAYRRWDPTRGVPFLAYATAMCRHAVNRWSHDNLTGRPGSQPKAHVGALSLHAAVQQRDDGEWVELGHPVDAAIGSWGGDPAEDCSADLGGVLARRSRGHARQERELGIRTDARTSEGDQAASV